MALHFVLTHTPVWATCKFGIEPGNFMLKKALYIVGGLAVGTVLLLPLFFGVNSSKDYLEAIAFVSFFVGIFLFFTGILLVLISLGFKAVMPFAQACLIMSGIIMLLSFTLCSTGIVRFQL